MQILRVVVLLVLMVGCRREERFQVLEGHLSDIQRRVGALEIERERPAWHCTAERCEREAHEGSRVTAVAWCRVTAAGAEGCRPTLTACGPGCIGVR